MAIKAELYWSFRSPYSYLGARRYVDGEPFHGQDRIDIALWRMQEKGLKARPE